MAASRSEVREPEAFLRRIVTRLCLDQLKSARRQREAYVGPWLPEPVVEEDEEEDITLPLMLALERLSALFHKHGSTLIRTGFIKDCRAWSRRRPTARSRPPRLRSRRTRSSPSM
jgi:hypothetical protein